MASPSDLQAAIALHQAGRLGEAIAAYRRLLPFDRGGVEVNRLLGLALFAAGDPAAALPPLDAALRHAPDNPALLNDAGNVLRALGRKAEAAERFRRALAVAPGFSAARFNLADCLLELKDLAAALAEMDRLLAAGEPDIDADFQANRGLALAGLGRGEEAEAAFIRALAMAPGHATALAGRAAAMTEGGRAAEAVALLEPALPAARSAEIGIALGHALLSQDEDARAEAAFAAALALAPRDPRALHGMGLARLAQGDAAGALARFDEAIVAAPPGSPDILSSRGLALRDLGRLKAAIGSLRAAARGKPGSAAIQINLANALVRADDADGALAAYRAAVAADPGADDAHLGLALMLQRRNEGEAAMPHFEAAARLRPKGTNAVPLSALVFARLQAGDWARLEEDRARLVEALGEPGIWADPFELLPVLDDPAVQRRNAEAFVRDRFPVRAPAAFAPRSPGRIRIGYVSSDVRDHAVSHLLARVLELHDRTAFDVHVFAIGPGSTDAYRQRIAAGVEHFHDCAGMDEAEVLALARGAGLDIAVDLNGHTLGAGTGLFARRLAPVQVNWLGFPGTSGAGFMDYVLLDPFVAPPGAEAEFTEAVVRLPHSYLPHDDTRAIADRPASRAEAGLPETGVVFCCFNNGYKIRPETFACWLRLLAARPDAVLWLRGTNEAMTRRLRAAAEEAGIDPARLVLAPRAPIAEHLARHRLADLFLDTAPYNAHTTAYDALWAGLPVLTCPGRAVAGRVAGALMTSLGLGELVADSPEAYEAIALALSADPGRLGAIRARLADTLRSAPLFDSARFARDLEAAFRAMAERQAAGLPSAGFDVPPAKAGTRT